MAESELIQAMCRAYDSAPDEEGADEAMARVLAVVRSHDAARVPADADLGWLVQCMRNVDPYENNGQEDEIIDAIIALRARIAALEAERDKLRVALTDFVEMGEGYGWGEALTGRQILMANARVALAPSDAQEGRADG